MKKSELEIEISETIKAVQEIKKTNDRIGLDLAEADLRYLQEQYKIAN